MPFSRHLALSCLFALASCGGGATTPTGNVPVSPLVVVPTAIQFSLFPLYPPPQLVTASKPSGFAGALGTSIADPTVAGMTPPVMQSSSTATFNVIEIARGSTNITVTDGVSTTTVAVASALCGRPDNLAPFSQLIEPHPGTSGNSTAVGKLYFVVYSKTAPSGFLHLMVGQHGTLEGGALQVDTPPPGTVLPTPPPVPGIVTTFMSATVPALQPGIVYGTQLYDDPCQPAIATGSFST